MKGVDLAMNHSNVKPTTKKRAKAVLSVFLVVAILIAGAYAFLSATDSKTNVFTVGNVDIELHEIFNGKDYGKGEDPGAIGDKIENIVPGQSIEKAPYVVNTGKNPAYTFIAVGIPTDTSANVYNGQGTYTAKSELDIKVKAYAIQQQYNGATDAESTWTNYFKNDMISGTASDAGIELFTLNDGTSAVTTGTHTIGSDWQEFSTPYSVNDGGNTYTYHFFKYVANNELLPVGTTTAHLFDKVVFNENIGNEKEPLLTLSPDETIPEDVKYIQSDGDTLSPGDKMPSAPRTGDLVRAGDYEYCYNSGGYEVQMNEWWNFNDSLNSWGTRLINKNITNVTQMLIEIEGKPVNIRNCFEWNDKIEILEESIIFPQNIIPERCFYNCSNLKSATINNNITIIEEDAFCGCEKLAEFVIPKGVTDIGQNAFSNCTGLTSITIPDGVKNIFSNAFSGVANVSYTENMQATGSPWMARCANGYIENGLVYLDSTKTNVIRCSTVKTGEVIIPNSVTSIEDSAFRYCSGLTNIIIPNSVTNIGMYAFSGCYGLINLIVPDSVVNIGKYAFGGILNVEYHGTASGSPWDAKMINGYLEDDLVYSDSSKQILVSCLSQKEGQVTIPDSVTTIKERAFSSCNKITDINIPNSVIKIENQAFAFCSGITSISIPDSVTNIGDNAFGWGGLNSVHYKGQTYTNSTEVINVLISNGVSVGNGIFLGTSMSS